MRTHRQATAAVGSVNDTSAGSRRAHIERDLVSTDLRRNRTSKGVKPFYGVVIGRFQPLHNDHLRFLLQAAKRCECLLVGIAMRGRPPRRILLQRSHAILPKNNPFNYFQRYEMVRDSLLKAGITRTRFEIFPMPPYYHPRKLLDYLPSEATIFLTDLDEWWEKDKHHTLKKWKYDVRVLRMNRSRALVRGTEVRRRLARGGDWEALVPGAVSRLIRSYERASSRFRFRQ